MENRVKRIMAAVLEIDAEQINSASSPDTIENWGSLRHMNLVVALEEEFDVEFDDEEIADLMDFNGIIESLKSKN